MNDCIDEGEWPKIQSVIMVISKRLIKGKESTETRYYITSFRMDVTEASLAIRRHWTIEDGLHWSLDIGFREDRQVAKKMNIAENLAIVRRIAFILLRKDTSIFSVENKRMKAALSTDYLECILEIKSMKSL